MAKLKMKKIELIAMLTDSKKIIELLQRRGVVEITENNDEELENTNVTAVVGEFDKFRNTAAQALEIIDNYAPEKASLNDLLGGRTEVEKHEFGKEAMHMEQVMGAAGEIIKNQRYITDSANSASQLQIKCDMLERWKNLDVPLNFKGTATTSAFIGTLPYLTASEELEEKLPENCSVEVISSTKDQTNVFIICSKDVYDEAEDILRRLAFAHVSEPESMTPKELIAEYTAEIDNLNDESEKAKENITKLAENRQKLRFVIDYLQMRKEKYDALSDLGFTGEEIPEGGWSTRIFRETSRDPQVKLSGISAHYAQPCKDLF